MSPVSPSKRKADSQASGPKKTKLPKAEDAKAADSAEMLIASNFARGVQGIANAIVQQNLPLAEFHFDAGGTKLVPYGEIDRNVSTNAGTLHLIKSLLTANNEADIDKALATDFTAVAANLPHGDHGGGCGGGFQVYLQGELMLTAGSGEGGGYSDDNEKILERGGGGGAAVFLPDGTGANVGGGHGLVDAKRGTVEAKNDDDHNPKLFVEKLQELRELLSGSNPKNVAVLGGGGGGGGETNILRLRSQGEKTDGGGYGFGFEIGSVTAIKLAKLGSDRPKRTAKAPGTLTITSFSPGPSYDTTAKDKGSGNDFNLPDHLKNEDWAQKMVEYKGKYAKKRKGGGVHSHDGEVAPSDSHALAQ